MTIGSITAPGVYPEVLAVGPLNGEGALQPYAEWTPKIRKPDFFMSGPAPRHTAAGGAEGERHPTARLALGPGNARLELLRAARRGRRSAGLVDCSRPDAEEAQRIAGECRPSRSRTGRIRYRWGWRSAMPLRRLAESWSAASWTTATPARCRRCPPSRV